jgi:hypothetical protein
MSEIEKRPWHYAREYLQAEKKGKKAKMREIWQSIPPHLLDMVKTHITNERAKRGITKRGNTASHAPGLD